jgi:exonuclease SbcC
MSFAAIPMIETRANDILRRLDWTYRLRLETQRELKSSSGVREVLDIMVEVGDGDQLFEQCSGGEQMAINLALRLAIAELIATRFGVEVRLLALDEPEFMDAGRLDLFIALLADLEQQAAFEKVILVSHNLELRHAFEMVIEIAGGGDSGTPSMVTGAREQVPA